LLPKAFTQAQNVPKSMAAKVSPQTPLQELSSTYSASQTYVDLLWKIPEKRMRERRERKEIC